MHFLCTFLLKKYVIIVPSQEGYQSERYPFLMRIRSFTLIRSIGSDELPIYVGNYLKGGNRSQKEQALILNLAPSISKGEKYGI